LTQVKGLAETNDILPGLSIDADGQATVDGRMAELLFELALRLEDAVTAPVDVEHVLAAIVLARSGGEIDATTTLTADNADLVNLLRAHIETVFEKYEGRLGRDDDAT
jgi:hypothetical protein